MTKPYASVSEMEQVVVIGNAYHDYDTWQRAYATVAKDQPEELRLGALKLMNRLMGENDAVTIEAADELVATLNELMGDEG